MDEIKLTKIQMASFIDHTILKPDASINDVYNICQEAKDFHFASVCVNPVWIEYVSRQLTDTPVTPCCVIGFPLGALTPEMKVCEASLAIAKGAKELDMVINIGAVKSESWSLVEEDIRAVAAVKKGALLKVIIETCLLTDEEKIKACLVAKSSGADFVKTSTGFSTGGATAYDISLMRKTVGPDIGVKASGKIRTLEDANVMITAGASRIGTSSGISILQSLD